MITCLGRWRRWKQHPSRFRKPSSSKSGFLQRDLRHPSLRAKKYDESRDLWQARVNESWRFYFNIVEGTYIIRDIVPHTK